MVVAGATVAVAAAVAAAAVGAAAADEGSMRDAPRFGRQNTEFAAPADGTAFQASAAAKEEVGKGCGDAGGTSTAGEEREETKIGEENNSRCQVG